MLAPLTLLLALCACNSSEDGMALTGACLYAARDPLVATCVNLWDGANTCQEVSEQSGSYQAGDSCGERGYERPCTHDYPWTLWIVASGDQAAEEAACDALMSDDAG